MTAVRLKPDVVLQDISRTRRMSRWEDGAWLEGARIVSIFAGQ